MAEMSEFARMLKQKREEREKKFQDPTSDPGKFSKFRTAFLIFILVCQLDRDLSVKRKPLLSAENSPKKPKNDSQKARHDKLARLAQNIRAMDAADRGDSISAADLVKTSPVKPSNNSPNRRRSHEQMENMMNDASKENSKPKKNSKWARLAQERECWDNDFQSSNQITEKEDRIVVAPKTPVKSRQPVHQSPKKTQESPKKQLHQSGSARNMVAEALARAGKSNPAKNEIPKVKTTSTANTRRIEPKSNKPNARIEGKFWCFFIYFDFLMVFYIGDHALEWAQPSVEIR